MLVRSFGKLYLFPLKSSLSSPSLLTLNTMLSFIWKDGFYLRKIRHCVAFSQGLLSTIVHQTILTLTRLTTNLGKIGNRYLHHSVPYRAQSSFHGLSPLGLKRKSKAHMRQLVNTKRPYPPLPLLRILLH